MEQLLDISDPRDLQAWARTFHVTPDRLVEVVRQWGASPERIRDALKRAELARVGGRHFGER